MDNKVLAGLVNAPFTFRFADREFQIKKANIRQVQQYVMRLGELMKDKEMNPAVRDLDVLSYCLFLSLSKVDPTITEDFVSENLQGAVDGLELLSELGFIDPEKVQMVKKVQEKLISGNST